MDAVITNAIARVSVLAVKNGAAELYRRVGASRERADRQQAENELVEIINELIQEKTELVTLARTLEDALAAEKISDDELKFIDENLIPQLLEFMRKAGEHDEEGGISESASAAKKVEDGVELLKPLLARESLTILQVMGFNFKAAIGGPLTELVARFVASLGPKEDYAAEVHVLNARIQEHTLAVARDPEAMERLRSLAGEP